MKLAYSFFYWITLIVSLIVFLKYPDWRIGGVMVNGSFQLFVPLVGFIIYFVVMLTSCLAGRISKRYAVAGTLITLVISIVCYSFTLPAFLSV